MTTSATASARPRTSAKGCCAAGGRWCSRSEATPSTSTPARSCRTSRRSNFPDGRSRSSSTAGGIRAVEIGTVMFGRRPDGTESPAPMDLVRLAIPRRTYTQSHVDYVIEVCGHVAGRAPALRGYRITSEPPALRHFTAQFEPLE